MAATAAGIFEHFNLSSNTDVQLLVTVLGLYLRGKKDLARNQNGISPLTNAQVATVERILGQMEYSPLMKTIILQFMESIEGPPSKDISLSDIAQEIACYATEEALDPASKDYAAATIAWNDCIPLHMDMEGLEAHRPDSSHGSDQSGVSPNEEHSTRLPIIPAIGAGKKGSSRRATVPHATGVGNPSSSPLKGTSNAGTHGSRFPFHQPTRSHGKAPAPQLPDFTSIPALFPHMPWHLAGIPDLFAPQNGSSSATSDWTAQQPRQRASRLDGANDEVEDWRSQQIEYDEKIARGLQNQMVQSDLSPQASHKESARPVKRVRYFFDQR